MSEDRVRRELRDHPLPDEGAARERAWRVVREAAVAQAPRPRRRPLRLALAAAAAGAVAAVALTPPGAAVGDWIQDVVEGRDDARPALASVPAPGRLLVTSPSGAWIVQDDGAARRLGPYGEADFSPRGLYVAVTRGRRLLAVDPKGEVRWSLTRGAPVRRPAWSNEPGYRVAYLTGGALRVVAGDGTGDRPLAPRVADVTPSWRPGTRHVLAYADRRGRIVVRDADTRAVAWRTPPGAAPLQIEWAPQGRLVVLTADGLRVYGASGELEREIPMPGATTMAVDPRGDEAALVRASATGGSEVVALPLKQSAPPRRLFRGEGGFAQPAWSPDGRWLLLPWRDADQWLFIRSARVRRIEAVSRVGRHFDPSGEGPAEFPRLAGWCCG